VPYSPAALTALAVATSFAAGLNVYATAATLGLLARVHVIALPPSLELLMAWPVIGASVVLYVIEFVIDKIPAVDLIWNALQTFVRVPVAGLLAYAATSQLPPTEQLLVSAVGAVVAFAAHGGKTAARVAVTPSPEPFSNIALSLGEDVVAVFVTWLATQHPFIAATIVAGCVFVLVLLMRVVFGAIRAMFRGAARQARTG
jgi:hypothetical protein